ncbi:MAG: hypothetical protein PVI83_02470 [Lysobacterales bacterium]
MRSSQAGVHPRLPAVLDRHRGRKWSQPLHAPTQRAFDRLAALLSAEQAPLVLDSGCGNAESTLKLAGLHPDALVIGVDKSAARLARSGAVHFPHRAENAIWLRAELATFWRLALQANWRLERHYLLYPNPWPKPGHLQRRWHAHPVFGDMLGLGGRLEMRCNWSVYAGEFAFSVNRLSGLDVQPVTVAGDDPLSAFERKYRDSGHTLYAVVCPLSSNTGVP